MKSLLLAFSLIVAWSALAVSHRPQTFPKKVGGPDVKFSDTAIAVSAVAPGATVYFAGLSVTSGENVLGYERAAGSAVADAAGVAAFTPATPIKMRSVWIVVDGSTGGYIVAAPHGMVIREMDLPGNVVPAANGALRRLQIARHAADVFLIRAGSGIWAAHLLDGGDLDNDRRENGLIDGDLASLAPVGGTQASAPASLSPGDILFFIERRSLEFAVAQHGR